MRNATPRQTMPDLYCGATKQGIRYGCQFSIHLLADKMPQIFPYFK